MALLLARLHETRTVRLAVLPVLIAKLAQYVGRTRAARLAADVAVTARKVVGVLVRLERRALLVGARFPFP
jgi:hypothetical protein